MAKVATMLKKIRLRKSLALQQAGSHSANARMPRGDTKARHMVEVPGATLDSHWLHAASVLFFKCGLPPYCYSRVVPVDASAHALAM